MTESESVENVATKRPAEDGESETQSQSTDNNAANPFKKPPKRPKIKKVQPTETTDNNDEHNVMPTPAPSKRQKKKLKKLQQTVKNVDKEIERTVAYLDKWDNNRSEWKYEKLRQIFIQKNVFNEEVISDEHVDTAIRYLATSQGKARSLIVESAEAVIKEIEEKMEQKADADSNSSDDSDDEEKDEADDKEKESQMEDLTDSARYKRAREVLQSMQD